MEANKPSQKQLRQKRFRLVLPALVLPFLVLAFWALGGGEGQPSAEATSKEKGLNLHLPGAEFKSDGPVDKLSFYEQAKKDSIKRAESLHGDPYYQVPATGDSLALDTTLAGLNGAHDPFRIYADHSSPAAGFPTDENEAKVYRRLNELNAALERSGRASGGRLERNSFEPPHQGPGSEVARMEQIMQTMQDNASGGDPELKQLDGMIDKLIDVQHPELVREKMRKASELRRGEALPVTISEQQSTVSLMVAPASRKASSVSPGFYSAAQGLAGSIDGNAIPAAVHGTQTLVAGATIKLRLLSDVFINGHQVPRDQFIYGAVGLNGDRLSIEVSSIRSGNSLFPVQLSGHDMDGMAGIYIPGAITRDVAKQSADQTLQGLGMATYDPSIGAQAAGAGIEAAKTLLSRKVKLIKVTVKSGYRVLLFDNKQKQY